MVENNKAGTSWWQTVPGVLTGIAAVITAVVGLLTLLFQNGVIGSKARSSGSASTPTQQSVANAPSDSQPETADQSQAGHLVYKVLDKQLSQYALNAKGKRIKSSLKLSLRITDVVGVADYVDRNTIRLLANGAEFYPETNLNLAIYSKQSIDTEVVFVIPSDVSRVELLVGRKEDATAKIPISLKP